MGLFDAQYDYDANTLNCFKGVEYDGKEARVFLFQKMIVICQKDGEEMFKFIQQCEVNKRLWKGGTLGTHLGRSGNALGTQWRHIGNALGTHWGSNGNALGTHLDAFGHIGDALETHWGHIGVTLERHWGRI